MSTDHDHHHHHGGSPAGCGRWSGRTATTPPTRSTRRWRPAPRASGRSKISLVGARLTAVVQLAVVAGHRLGGAAGRHHAQLRRRADRGPAVGRVRPRPAGRDPPLHLRLRPGRGPGRAVHRRDDRAVRGRRRLRVGPPADRPAAGHERRRASSPPAWSGSPATSSSRGYRIRVGRRIGSAALVADGLHARTDGFTSLAVVLGADRRAGRVPAGRPDRRPADHRGDPGRAARRRPRHLPADHGRRRPAPGRRGGGEPASARRACRTSRTCGCAGSGTASGPRPASWSTPGSAWPRRTGSRTRRSTGCCTTCPGFRCDRARQSGGARRGWPRTRRWPTTGCRPPRPAETGHRHQGDAGAHGHRHPDNAGAHGHRHPDPSHGHAPGSAASRAGSRARARRRTARPAPGRTPRRRRRAHRARTPWR